jgi:rfaE bifunctional protein kinase chain/domain
VPSAMRLEGLRSISMVDHAVLLSEPAHEFIAKLKPEIVVKGKEYQDQSNPEQEIVDGYGGKLVFTSGEMRFATSDLLKRDYFTTNFSTIQKPTDFPQRHGFQIAELKQMLAAFTGIRVLVVGDLIVDTYVDCEPLGMSREDPTVVVAPLEQKTFLGGAGIVAAHLRGLGADVQFLSVAGKDEATATAEMELRNFGIEHELLLDPTRPTTTKTRYRAQGKTLLRLNNLRQHAIDDDLVAAFLKRVDKLLPQTDLLLFSDFNYGCLPQVLVDAVIERAAKHNVMMGADSQASSQLSDISRFKGMSLITPTEHEARLATMDFESGLVILSEKLRQSARAEHVIVTLGAEGLLLHAPGYGQQQTDRLPAFNTAPKDVAGAGDCLFACTALGLRAGFDIWKSTYLGALAAGHQVSRVGNLPISRKDLMTEIDYAPAD